MWVRMTSTRAGSPDGVRVQFFKIGQVYDLPDSFAAAFVSEGWADISDEREVASLTVASGEPIASKRLYPPPRKGRR